MDVTGHHRHCHLCLRAGMFDGFDMPSLASIISSIIVIYAYVLACLMAWAQWRRWLWPGQGPGPPSLQRSAQAWL